MFATAVSVVCLLIVHGDYFKGFYSFAQNNLQKSFIHNSQPQVCVCVCMCVCVCVCMPVCMYVSIYACMYIYMHGCKYVCMYVCAYISYI